MPIRCVFTPCTPQSYDDDDKAMLGTDFLDSRCDWTFSEMRMEDFVGLIGSDYVGQSHIPAVL
jgi:hypothetical protein